MNITSDDPRLIAYVLDELDQDGRNFIENEMQRRSECRFEARELAAFTDQLRDALATEPMPELAAKQERAIAAWLQQTGSRRKPFWIPIAASWLLRAELAVLALVVLLFIPFPASLSTPMRKLFAYASAHTARAMLQAVGTHVEWRGSSLILPGPTPLLPSGITPPPGIKPPPGVRFPTRTTIAIDFETWTCNPRFWITLLLVTGFLSGHLYLRSALRKLTLIALALPLVVLSDALRKFALAEWLVHTSSRTAELPPFQLVQPLFVLFSLLALLPFLIWFRRSEKKRKM